MVGKIRFLLRAVICIVPVVAVYGLMDLTASQTIPAAPVAPLPAENSVSPGFSQPPPPEPATTSKPVRVPTTIRGYYDVITVSKDVHFGRIMNSELCRFESGLVPATGSIPMESYAGKFCEFTGYPGEYSPEEGHPFQVMKATIIAPAYFIIGTVTVNDRTIDPEMGSGVDWQINDEEQPQVGPHYLVFLNQGLPSHHDLQAGQRYRATGRFTSWGHKGLGVAFACTDIEALP